MRVFEIERTEVQWTSDEARQVYEHILDQVRNVMALPPHLVRAGPVRLEQFQREAIERAAPLQSVAANIYRHNTTVVGYGKFKDK
jgi:hypothetical protein